MRKKEYEALTGSHRNFLEGGLDCAVYKPHIPSLSLGIESALEQHMGKLAGMLSGTQLPGSKSHSAT